MPDIRFQFVADDTIIDPKLVTFSVNSHPILIPFAWLEVAILRLGTTEGGKFDRVPFSIAQPNRSPLHYSELSLELEIFKHSLGGEYKGFRRRYVNFASTTLECTLRSID